MSGPRLHVAAPRRHEPVRLSPAARVLEQLHVACWGRQAELRGTHSPEHRRHQLMGGSGLAVEGICYLLLRAPEAVRGALEVMAEAVGCALEPLPEATASLGRQAADVSRSGGELAGAVTESLEDDGVVDQVELGKIRARMAEHKRALSGLEAEVARLQLEPRRRSR